MPRTKVKLAFIDNPKSRRQSYRKRTRGLINKVNELSTLCGVDACVIVYNPHKSQSEQDVWPGTVGRQRILDKFQSVPKKERSNKMVNQEEYSKQELTEATEQLAKLRKDNRKKQITLAMHQCLPTGKVPNFSLEDLKLFNQTVNETVVKMNNAIEPLKNDAGSFRRTTPPTLPQEGDNRVSIE